MLLATTLDFQKLGSCPHCAGWRKVIRDAGGYCERFSMNEWECFADWPANKLWFTWRN